MNWWRTLFLVVALAALQYPLWMGKGNFNEVRLSKKRVEIQKQEVDKLERRNKAMSAEIQDLQQGQEAIAEIARDEIGYIAPGEHFYRIKNK
ncbi:septum formation initiator family protein [Neisseria sp. Ec49-e6-T10]|uniref:septum formation initiator family protein n=1 Tax=Neisseria sp. Ec49-e6-T10 TaxID=3140744 RepID=UPI003EB6B50D